MSPRTVTVLEGETLFSIAVRTTGDGNRALEIYELNKALIDRRNCECRGLTDKLVVPGMKLIVPSDRIQAPRGRQARRYSS